MLRAALNGGVDIVQLREKELPDREIELAALTFRRLCDTYSALFIVNDDPELARACDADGVHVGQDDMPVAEARAPARAGRDHRPLNPLRGADRRVRRAAGRLHQRRPDLGDADQRGPAGRRPRPRPARGRARPPPVLRDRRHRLLQRGGGGRRGCRQARRRASDPRRRRARRGGRSAALGACRRRRGTGWLSRRKRKGRPDRRERMERGYAKAETRNREAREALEPLAEGERPLVVTIGAAISALLALSILGRLSGRSRGRRRKTPSRPGPRPGAADGGDGLGHVAGAVLGGSRLPAAARLPDLQRRLRASRAGGQRRPVRRDAGAAGRLRSFFFFMVKAMARIQMPQRK